MSFGKAFFSSCLGALVALFLFCGLLLFLVSLSSGEKVEVSENSVLHIKLDVPVKELQQEDPLAGLPLPGVPEPNIGLLQLKRTIEYAKTDPKIKGIYLESSYPMTGFSSIEELRESLIDFRTSGKWVVAYNEVMSEGAYYLATAADKIYLNPEGQVEFNGLTIELVFFKKLFDKLGIRPQVFRVGEFKSAVEPFLLDKMSEENRLQLSALIQSIYGYMLNRISEARNIPVEKLKHMADNLTIRTALHAYEYGLVDSLLYTDQFIAELKGRMGLGEDDEIPLIKYNRYRKSFSTYKSTRNEIAVIVAEGTIVPGEGDPSQQVVAAETFAREIRKARKNDNVKAIVLRINSPGGAFRASDMIWREIELARQVKPVIASMSDLAASGGYYLAMGCDTIVAQPHTITGSIGIYGVVFDLSHFLGDKLGITFDEVRTGNYGELLTVTRPLTESEKNFWQKNLNEHYETFIQKAAEGRGVPADDIRKVASGRVWSGEQARDRRLVDVMGGFKDAIAIAAGKAGIGDEYKIRFYPQPQPFFVGLLKQMEENSGWQQNSEMQEIKYYYQQLKKIGTHAGSQARMPFELRIH